MVKLAEFVIKYRWGIILSHIILSLLFLFPLTRAEVDPDVQNMLPADMKERLDLQKIEALFGGTEIALVIMEAEDILAEATLDRAAKIADAIRAVPGIDRVSTLPNIGGDDFADEEPTPEQKKEKREAAREEIRKNDLIYGTIVSKDFRYLAIVVKLSAQSSETLRITGDIRRTAEEVPGTERLVYGGLPFIKERISEDVPKDMFKFLPAGILVMMLFLYISFRQFRGILLPFSIVAMSIVVSMGLIPLFGWKMQTVTMILPVIMIAVANNYAVHLVSRYQQDNRDDCALDKVGLAKLGILSLGAPVIATGVTTIGGIMSILTHRIVPAKQLGILAGIGITFALAASLLFIPAVLSLLRKPRPVIEVDYRKRHLLERFMYGVAYLISKNPKQVLVVTLLAALVAALFIPRLTGDSNLARYYPAGSTVARSSEIVNEQFGGGQIVNVVVEGDIKEPSILRKVDTFEKEMEKLPEVGKSTSIVRLIKMISRNLHKPSEPGYDAIPDSRGAVDFYLTEYAKMADIQEIAHLVTADFRHAQIMVQINDEGSGTIKRVVAKVNELTAGDPAFRIVGGSGYIFAALIDEVSKGQVTSLILSVIIVAILVMLLFRSFMAGFVASIPLALALVFLFGIMGGAGIPLDIATAMLSSIMIGVGVDYTIHFLWRYREELRLGKSPEKAMRRTLRTTGRGIVFNAVSVMLGFSVLILSVFMPIRFFGVLIVLAISTCLLGALFIMPAYCLVFRPKFLEKR
ncbi:MAG TPA: MMPL family transporter [bacterium]|nr:MMPL family transporter [bacterium]